MSWHDFLQSGEGKVLVILFFMGVITLSLIVKIVSAVFRRNSRGLSDSKILGGLSVLLVAIIADNGWIYFLSLFIAGLLIASERFMLLLAAVFNSDRTNVHKIPSYWQEEEKSYSRQELVETIENSVEETSTTDSSKDSKGKKAATKKDTDEERKERIRTYVQKISDIESKVVRLLENRVDYKYQLKESVAVKVDGATLRYDAIAVEPETNMIKGAFEIKYFAAMRSISTKTYLESYARRYLSPEYKVGFIFVFDNYNHDELDRILKMVKAFEGSTPNAFVAIYQDEDRTLTPLYETSLKREFPTNIERLFG